MRTSILSQHADTFSYGAIKYLIGRSLQTKKKFLLFAMNFHILIELAKNPKIKRMHSKNGIIFLDGVPLVWLASLKTGRSVARVSGTQLTEYLLKRHKNIFLIAANTEVRDRVIKKYPQAIVGTVIPPFGSSWDTEFNEFLIETINNSKAEIILIGISPLKQEKWLLQNFHKVNACIGIGVGSAFEILVGLKPRAPYIFQFLGIEWLWRIALEPRRLMGRYISDIWYFILRINKFI